MQKIMTYIAITAGVLFILFGIAILVLKNLLLEMPTSYKVIMGIVFILYGLFRLINVYNKRQRQDENDI